MGIPHFEDLSISEVERVFSAEKHVITAKLDGSYLAFGIDLEGRFYTERKGGQRYYEEGSWPVEGWANGFRQAHMVLEAYMDLAVQQGQAGRLYHETCEVLYGYQPNTVEYAKRNRLILHNRTSLVKTGDYYDAASYFEIRALKLHSADGRSTSFEYPRNEWMVDGNCHLPIRLLEVDKLRPILEWSNGPSAIVPFSRGAILEINLNKRPVEFLPATWRAMVPDIKRERERLRERLREQLLELKSQLIAQSWWHAGNKSTEGFVVNSDDFIFKMVNREWFAPVNHFNHRVRYALIGGRRPAKSSFSSRTRSWPMEKRLARLDVLRKRYLRYRSHVFREVYDPLSKTTTLLRYEGEVHERNLLLFHDLRQRILDGRTGF